MPGGSGRRDPEFIRRAEALLAPACSALAVTGALAGAAIVVLIGASVAMRHLASAPFRFTEELVGLLMTAAFFLALPLVTLRSGHVRIQFFVDALPRRTRRIAAILANLLGILFCLWFVWLALPWLDFAFQRNIRSETARLLLYPWMAVLPLSLILTALAFSVRCLADRGAENPDGGTGAA